MGHYFEGILLEKDQIADALLPIASGEPFETQDVIDRLITMGQDEARAARAAKGLLLREDRGHRISLGLDGWSAAAERHFGLPGRLGFLIRIENQIVDHGASIELDQMLARAFLPTCKSGFPAYTTSGDPSSIKALVEQIFPHWYVTPQMVGDQHWIELEGYLHALPFRNTRKGPARSTFEYRGTPDWLTASLPSAYAHALLVAAIKHERYDLLGDKQQYPDEDHFAITPLLRSARLRPISSEPNAGFQIAARPPGFYNRLAINLSSHATDSAADQLSAISQELASTGDVMDIAVARTAPEVSHSSPYGTGATARAPWNAGRKVGPKRVLTGQHIQSVRAFLEREGRIRDKALFDLAIDSNLKGRDLIKIKISELSNKAHSSQFELTAEARASLNTWLERRGGDIDDFAFPSRVDAVGHISTRQYARLVDEWVSAIGLNPEDYGTHSLRHTKASVRKAMASLPSPEQRLPVVAQVEFEHSDLDLGASDFASDRTLSFDDGRRFITFEGGEGTGKSTQAEALCAALSLGSGTAILTREPGGTELAEAVRARILDKHYAPMGTAAEALAFSFARLEHMTTKILPALARGDWVVCDRFYDSTRAYQGAAGNVDQGFLDMLDSAATAGRTPDLTIILDLPAEISLARAAARRGDAAPDRFEGEALGFHQRLRVGFLEIAARNPGRCHVINCEGLDPLQVQQRVLQVVKSRLMGGATGKILR